MQPLSLPSSFPGVIFVQVTKRGLQGRRYGQTVPTYEVEAGRVASQRGARAATPSNKSLRAVPRPGTRGQSRAPSLRMCQGVTHAPRRVSESRRRDGLALVVRDERVEAIDAHLLQTESGVERTERQQKSAHFVQPEWNTRVREKKRAHFACHRGGSIIPNRKARAAWTTRHCTGLWLLPTPATASLL